LIAPTAFGQKWIPEVICSDDTIMVETAVSMKQPGDTTGGNSREPFPVVVCSTRSNIGLRVEVAVSSYHYGDKTASWIGQHGGPNFNFILMVKKFNFGFRFKPWTIDPQNEMSFNEQTLPKTAELNNIRLDYYVGYSIDFEKLISVEPYVGYNRTSFHVINEDEINQEFSFNKTGGLIVGTSLNKYFKIGEHEYFSVFGTVGYGFVDYQKVHPDLDNGYFEWNIGIAYKGFGRKRFAQRVD